VFLDIPDAIAKLNIFPFQFEVRVAVIVFVVGLGVVLEEIPLG